MPSHARKWNQVAASQYLSELPTSFSKALRVNFLLHVKSWKLSLMQEPLFSKEAGWSSYIDRLRSLDLLQNGNQAKE